MVNIIIWDSLGTGVALHHSYKYIIYRFWEIYLLWTSHNLLSVCIISRTMKFSPLSASKRQIWTVNAFIDSLCILYSSVSFHICPFDVIYLHPITHRCVENDFSLLLLMREISINHPFDFLQFLTMQGRIFVLIYSVISIALLNCQKYLHIFVEIGFN